MFATGSILQEGFIILPILDDLESTEWLQREKDPSDYLSSINLVESDDEELDYTGISFSNDEYEEGKKNERWKKEVFYVNLNHRMWSIACLQRSDAVSLLGFYPEVLAINNTTGEQYRLSKH